MATGPRRSRTIANSGRRGSRRRSRASRPCHRRLASKNDGRFQDRLAPGRSAGLRNQVSGPCVGAPLFMNRSIASSLTVLLAALAVAQEPLTPRPSQSLDAAWQEALTLARTHKAPLLAFVLPRPDE